MTDIEPGVEWQLELNDFVSVLEITPSLSKAIAGSLGGDVVLINTNDSSSLTLKRHEMGALSAAWSSDGNFVASGGQDGNVHIYDSAGLSIGSVKDTEWVNVLAWSPEDPILAIGAGKKLLIVNAEGKILFSFDEQPSTVTGIAWSTDGSRVGVSCYGGISWYDVAGPRSGKSRRFDWKGSLLTLVISPDGNLIAYLGYDDKVQTYQTTNLYLMDINGDNKREIKTNLDRSIASLKWSKDGKNLFFMYDDEGNTKVALTSLYGKTKNLVDNVGGTTIGRPYGGGSYSISNNNKLVFTLTSPYHPSDIAINDGKSTNRLTNLNFDLLDKKDLGKVEEVWYKSSVDGRDIQGWIAKPPKFDSNKKYPLIVENHGGPISNYGARFSPEILLYSSAGYVVFYPNPRGSTSYGEEFGNLLYRNYPGDDYNDVMDGVDKMIDLGYIDEDNLFVTGGSAGGIMTAWIIGKNNRFKASAVIKPVMNWISKTLVADNYFGYAHSRYEGQPWENFNHYWSFSPISLVGNVETPTMVMVGLDDLRTPPSEAKQLYHALKLRKVETVYVEIPGASHNISNRPSQLITKIDHILYWFNKYLNN